MSRVPDGHLAGLETLVGPKGLRTGRDAAPFLVDWRGRQSGEAEAVVMPASTGEVSAVVRYCAANGLKIYPQGGNTGLCGGAVPAPGVPAIVLSTARMTAIREVDPVGNVAVVEAGVPLAVVHQAVAAFDRVFPLHLGSEGTAQIGGLVSTNAGGTAAVRYGVMRSLVMGLEAVLPDGSVIRRLGGLVKDNRGYDWKHLLIGGEGTLGIVTAAALRLHPRIRDEAPAAGIRMQRSIMASPSVPRTRIILQDGRTGKVRGQPRIRSPSASQSGPSIRRALRFCPRISISTSRVPARSAGRKPMATDCPVQCE